MTVSITSFGSIPALSVRSPHRAADGLVPLAAPRQVLRAGGVTSLWLGPDEWLLLGTETPWQWEHSVRATLGGGSYVTDVTAAREAFELTGPDATDVLRHGCALDFRAAQFPANAVAQTTIALANAIITRTPDTDGYLVLARTSFARYFETWLIDAATEYEPTFTRLPAPAPTPPSPQEALT